MAERDGGGGAGIYQGDGNTATDILGGHAWWASILRGGRGGDETHPDGYDGLYRAPDDSLTSRRLEANSQGGGGAATAGRGGKGVIGARARSVESVEFLPRIERGMPGIGGLGGLGGYSLKINNVQVTWVGGFTPDQVKGIVG